MNIGVLKEKDKEWVVKVYMLKVQNPIEEIKKITFRYITVNLKKIPMTKTENLEQNNNVALDNNNLIKI